jgi:hypothetical protein
VLNLTLAQAWAIGSAIVAAAIIFTWSVAGKINTMDSNVAKIADQMTRQMSAQEKDHLEIEAQAKRHTRVYGDLIRLGEKAGVRIDTQP